MTRFSVITITKDDPQGLAATKASVEAQDFHDFEWILVDGNAQSDAGIYDAMNKGLARASGDYVIFMNGGDVFANPHVLGIIAEREGDFIYGDCLEDTHTKRAGHDITRGMFTHHQAMCYKRSVIGDLRFDTRYKIAADYKFTAQFLARAATRDYIPLPLCVFETGGISQRRTQLGRREQHAIRRDLNLCPMFVAWGIYGRQVLAQAIRVTMPRVYWRLKRR